MSCFQLFISGNSNHINNFFINSLADFVRLSLRMKLKDNLSKKTCYSKMNNL